MEVSLSCPRRRIRVFYFRSANCRGSTWTEFAVSEFLVLQLPSRTLPPESQISCSCKKNTFSHSVDLNLYDKWCEQPVCHNNKSDIILYDMVCWELDWLQLQISTSNQISLPQKWPYPVLLPDLSLLLNLSLLHYLPHKSVLLVTTTSNQKSKYTLRQGISKFIIFSVNYFVTFE